MKLPYRIGLTGNIATGKTTVGHMLESLGAVLIDADKVVHVALAPGGAAFEPVTQAFGPAIVARDGTVDRRKLGDLVFTDPDALRRLETLVHPPVIQAVDLQIALCRAPVVAVEAIKLLESGMAATYDAIWVTVCGETTQVSRLMEQRGYDRATALQRVRLQPPEADKIAAANVVIRTDRTLDETRLQVEAAWRQIQPILSDDEETQEI